MKFRKDVVLALVTLGGAIFALFALFVTIPVWLFSVVTTLTVVGTVATISEIVKAYKASYDEGNGKHTYKFALRAFLVGLLVLVALEAIALFSLLRLYGFALIPVVVLLATLLVTAYLKKFNKLFWISLVALFILVVALISYGTSMMVKNDIDLNPGISAETDAPETDAPETDAPETDAPETDAPETDAPETDAPETDAPETDAPETDAPETDVPETDAPETDAPETDAPETNAPETDAPETDAPETDAPETDAPETDAPETDVPVIKDEIIDQGFVPVVVKIHAPETMRYAEPIIITLEGIKSENLKFGNEDFLAIAIISETEVEVTLVGIVNDAGEIEFVPAAGYITVTDSVTGANVVIEIVE